VTAFASPKFYSLAALVDSAGIAICD
jgi:hypothetical protein